MSAPFAHALTAGTEDYPRRTRDEALVRLDGARAAHMHPAVADMIRLALDSHPANCGVRHVLGRAECRFHDAALRVLGIGVGA
jgi:hypothetical protein